ncbi:MAG: hypothetical protein H6515_06515 [Microthrixaceae bacterium]|nr:hypothetical protein [Microthrixaceae bacterium]
MQTADEVASVIAFLMSDDARYITGEAGQRVGRADDG